MDIGAEHNATQVARNLVRAAREVADLEPVNTAAGNLVLARAEVPRLTGALDRSLQVHATGTTATIASPLAYAYRARPGILAAIRATSEEVLDLYTAHVTAALNKV